MLKKEKITISFNPTNDSTVYEYIAKWQRLIHEHAKKEKLKLLRKERKAKIKKLFKNI